MTTQPYAWREWFSAQGLEIEGDMLGDRMELFSMATQAATNGLGAALLPRFFVERELESGELVALIGKTFQSGLSYYLIHPEGNEIATTFQVFREWVLAQAQEYAIRLSP